MKLRVGVVAQLFSQDGMLAPDEQQLLLQGQGSHLVGREQGPPGVLLRLVAAKLARRRRFRAVNHRRLPCQVGHELGAFVVRDPEELQHPGVGQEGIGLLAIDAAQLVNVLQDGPQLDAVARHEPHCLFDGGKMPQGGEFVQQVHDGLGRPGAVNGNNLQVARNTILRTLDQRVQMAKFADAEYARRTPGRALAEAAKSYYFGRMNGRVKEPNPQLEAYLAASEQGRAQMREQVNQKAMQGMESPAQQLPQLQKQKAYQRDRGDDFGL